MVATSKLLIIDDDVQFTNSLANALKDKYQVHVSNDGLNSIDIYQVLNPDLVLLDVALPDVSGYEVCKKIRMSNELNQPKIIMITGNSSIEDKVNGYESGATDYLTKPFLIDELYQKLNVYEKINLLEKMLRETNENLERIIEDRTKKLIEQEKLAYLGLHTAELVHNIKSPITVIQLAIDMMKMNDQNNKHLKRIQDSLDSIINIIQINLLNKDRNFHLNEYMHFNLIEIVDTELDKLVDVYPHKKNLKIIKEFDKIPKLYGRKVNFEIAIQNLVTHSLDSLSKTNEDKILKIFISNSVDSKNIECVDSFV